MTCSKKETHNNNNNSTNKKPTTDETCSSKSVSKVVVSNKSVIVFSTSITRHLSTSAGRLPPTYIGIRRVRPSSKVVQHALLQIQQQQQHQNQETNGSLTATVATSSGQMNSNSNSNNNNINKNNNNAPSQQVVYKIVDPITGLERRMTKQEKKAQKMRQRTEAKERKVTMMMNDTKEKEEKMKEQKEEPNNELLGSNTITPVTQTPAAVDQSQIILAEGNNQTEQESGSKSIDDNQSSDPGAAADPMVSNYLTNNNNQAGGSSDRYMQLEIDANALTEELADIRGERSVVPPVALPPSMARMAILNGSLFQGHDDEISSSSSLLQRRHVLPLEVVADDALASQWATLLRQSMQAAETTRGGENLRPLPYIVNPEVWTRLRPTLCNSPDDSYCSHESTTDRDQQSESAAKEGGSSDNYQGWFYCQIQPSLGASSHDRDVAAVVQLLHHGTNLHLSCGAKFGSDYLLYDGPRSERHAFAGLRFVNYNDQKMLPVPSAYDLAGYVRGLNTAGKLALLATVVTDGSLHRVAIVDLALEKIVETTFKQRPVGKKQTKIENLAKK